MQNKRDSIFEVEDYTDEELNIADIVDAYIGELNDEGGAKGKTVVSDQGTVRTLSGVKEMLRLLKESHNKSATELSPDRRVKEATRKHLVEEMLRLYPREQPQKDSIFRRIFGSIGQLFRSPAVAPAYYRETQESPSHALLKVISGDEIGREYQISEAQCTIGLSDDVEIRLEDRLRHISRRHVQIAKEGDEFYIIDLESMNGTWLNDKKLKPFERKKLASGDKLKLADTVLEFVLI